MAKHHPDLIFCRKQAGVGKAIYLLDLNFIKSFKYTNCYLMYLLTNTCIANKAMNVRKR